MSSILLMPSILRLRNISTVILALGIIACNPAQANQFACELPNVETQSPQSAPGLVRGELTVDNEKITLNHVYAIARDPIWEDASALTRNQSKSKYTVLVTEKPLPNHLLKEFERTGKVGQTSIVNGTVKGLLFVLDQKGYNATFLYPQPSGWGMSSYSESLDSGKVQITANQIAAEIDGSAPLVQNFVYRLSFKTPIRQPAFGSNTQLVVGKATLDTLPLKAFIGYLGALKQKNLEQLRLYMTDETLKSVNQTVANVGTDKFFLQLQQGLSYLGMTDTAIEQITRKSHPHKVVIRGGQAKIVLKIDPSEEPVSSFSTFLLSCENGAWKL